MTQTVADRACSSRLRLIAFVAVALVLIGTGGASERERAARTGTPRASGLIVQDRSNPMWLMRQGGDHVFVSGPGDPEDFLYRGTRRADGTRDGDQEALIRKLIAHGGNCVYLQVVRSHGGDGKPDHNPFVGSDPARGLSKPILDQWAGWFDLMDRNGIVIVLFVYDDSARVWNTGDTVGPDERAFLEELVRRFRRYDRLIWVVAEEAEEAYSAERCQAMAGVVARADRPGRIIANHHHSGTDFKSWTPDGSITRFAMQLNVPIEQVHSAALDAVRRSQGRYGILYAENTEMDGADSARAHAFIWASAMAGLMPMLYGCDIASTPPETLRLFRIQQRFFEATDYHTMTPHDELAEDASTWALADPGRSYILLSPTGATTLGIKDLPKGSYSADWTDTLTGKRAAQRPIRHTGGALRLPRPKGIGPLGVVWVRRR